MKAVLHDAAKACSRLVTGAVASALWNASPSTVSRGGHVTGDDGRSPRSINAVEVSTLNDDPGGNEPSSARSKPFDPGTLTDARTWPVPALTATSAAFLRTLASAVSASRWTTGSMLVCTGVPGLGEMAATVAMVSPTELTALMVAPGRPA